MAHDKNLFLKYKHFNPLELIYLRNNTTQEIQGEGDVYFTLPQGELISICKILHIPNLKKIYFQSNTFMTIIETFTSTMEYALSKTP